MKSKEVLQLLNLALTSHLNEHYSPEEYELINISLQEFIDQNNRTIASLNGMNENDTKETTSTNKTVPNNVLHQATAEYLRSVKYVKINNEADISNVSNLFPTVIKAYEIPTRVVSECIGNLDNLLDEFIKTSSPNEISHIMKGLFVTVFDHICFSDDIPFILSTLSSYMKRKFKTPLSDATRKSIEQFYIKWGTIEKKHEPLEAYLVHITKLLSALYELSIARLPDEFIFGQYYLSFGFSNGLNQIQLLRKETNFVVETHTFRCQEDLINFLKLLSEVLKSATVEYDSKNKLFRCKMEYHGQHHLEKDFSRTSTEAIEDAMLAFAIPFCREFVEREKRESE